uniref:YggS family pyridoxal phosphate-dependent enzyme n=1 Tax=Petrachloros mirabilis TaxID=2918835 RepID=UPI003084341F
MLKGSIAERVALIRQSLPAKVRLIAVTKQVSVTAMRQAYAAGIRDFGENRLQEARDKQGQLQDLTDVTWHFIGHVQRNKAKAVVESFHWIHAVDRLSLAQRLDQLAGVLETRPKVCLQVKLWSDSTKQGWSEADLRAALSQLYACQHLNLCGLMAILPLGLTSTEILSAFEQVSNLAAQIRHHENYPLPIHQLSMGMSGDFQAAVQAGSTMVRLGRILFGERSSL